MVDMKKALYADAGGGGNGSALGAGFAAARAALLKADAEAAKGNSALEKELTAELAKLGIVGEEAAAAVQVKFC